MTKVTGHATRTREIRLVNPAPAPRRSPMATKKKASKKRAKNPSKKKGGHHKKRAKNPKKHHRRRRNPSGGGLLAAVAGGAAARVVRGTATVLADEVMGKKQGMERALGRAGAALTPLGLGYLVNDSAPNFAKGAAGVTGAGLVEVGTEHFGADKRGKKPKWLKLLIGPGTDHCELPDGGRVYHDPTSNKVMYEPSDDAMPPGQMGPPAPVPLQTVPAGAGAVFTMRSVDPQSGRTLGERQLQPMAMLPGYGALVMDARTKEFDTIKGITSLTQLQGIVEVKGLVQV
jgi:hypothetical protein